MDTKPVLLLDGGMGTTLESLGADVSNPLWGCQLVHSDPETISSVHRGFIDAGADIIETATYQMTVDLLVAQGHSVDQAKTIMRSAVHIAHTAAQTKGTGTDKPKVVALSIGPLGATLQPGQEYAGNYPPPYGPFTPPTPTSTSTPVSTAMSTSTPTSTATSTLISTSTSSPSASETATNAFPSLAEENSAEEALTQFHLDRLRVFALHEPTWRAIEWIAFETIPLIREIRAIRRAMKVLLSELETVYAATTDGNRETGDEEVDGREERYWYNKKFWITSAYPLGQHGTKSLNGESISTTTIVHSLLDPMVNASTPNGVGINCTNPTYLSSLVNDFTQTKRKIISQNRGANIITSQNRGATTITSQNRGASTESEMDRPYFVLYPDGGNIYDVITRQWSEGKLAPNDWAAGIAGIVRNLSHEDSWGGIIVGGCCKAGFSEIEALRRDLDEI